MKKYKRNTELSEKREYKNFFIDFRTNTKEVAGKSR